MTIAQEAETIVTEIMANPRIVQKIKDGMTPSEAVKVEVDGLFRFWAKTDRNTAKGRELDDLCIKTSFNWMLQQLN